MLNEENQSNQYVGIVEASDITGVDMAYWVRQGRSPSYIVMGHRKFFKKADLITWTPDKSKPGPKKKED